MLCNNFPEFSGVETKAMRASIQSGFLIYQADSSYWVSGSRTEDTEMDPVALAESESFNEAETKTRKSEITAEVQQVISRSHRGKTGNKLGITQKKAGALTKTPNDLAQTGRRTQHK